MRHHSDNRVVVGCMPFWRVLGYFGSLQGHLALLGLCVVRALMFILRYAVLAN